MLWWLGYHDGLVDVFAYPNKPTARTHREYQAVAGPYMTREDALTRALRFYGGQTRLLESLDFALQA